MGDGAQHSAATPPFRSAECGMEVINAVELMRSDAMRPSSPISSSDASAFSVMSPSDCRDSIRHARLPFGRRARCLVRAARQRAGRAYADATPPPPPSPPPAAAVSVLACSLASRRARRRHLCAIFCLKRQKAPSYYVTIFTRTRETFGAARPAPDLLNAGFRPGAQKRSGAV